MMSSYFIVFNIRTVSFGLQTRRVNTQLILEHGHQIACHVLFAPIDALLLRTIGIADDSLECGTFLCEDEFAAMRRIRCLNPEGQVEELPSRHRQPL